MSAPSSSANAPQHLTTLEVAGMLGMAVRSVQMMVDRGDLEAWKTPGGHRRILRSSVDRWLGDRVAHLQVPVAGASAAPGPSGPSVAVAAARNGHLRVLVIEDSAHYQHLLSLLIKQQLPEVDLHVADDGIAGLAMVGQLDPDVLIIDILLPGIDGATLITSLRSHPQFRHNQLIVVTALDELERAPYSFALAGVPVVHKTRIVNELPGLLATCASHSRGAVRRTVA